MLYAFLISAILLLIGVLLMGFRIFFVKNGEFPNIHIGGNKGLKNKGVDCATSQDKQARTQSNPSNISKLVNEVTENF